MYKSLYILKYICMRFDLIQAPIPPADFFQFSNRCLIKAISQHLCWIPRNYRIRRHILSHDCASPNNRAVANILTGRQDDCILSNPNIIANR